MSTNMDEKTQREITFIGSLKSTPKGGETVKNSILVEALEKKEFKLNKINILMPKISLIKHLSKLFFKRDRNLVMSLSSKARLFFIPYVFFLIKINHYRVVLLPIGGKMRDEIDDLPGPLKRLYIKFLNEYDQIYVESKELKHQMNDMLDKEIVSYLPNFKKRPDVVPKISIQEGDTFNMVYLGMMTEDKGIFDILRAFEIIGDEYKDIEMHFYGSFGENDNLKKKFNSRIREEDRIVYHGFLSNEKLIETLNNHHVFIFPTYHEGECFPGVLLDAFFSGLPVIASNWRFNSEIVEDGRNGLLCEPKEPKDLADKMKKLYEDKELLIEMSKNVVIMSERYDVDNVIDTLSDDLKDIGWFE